MEIISAIYLSMLFFAYDVHCISLNGKWDGYIIALNATFNLENETARPFQAEVPGGVYTDLVRAGIIPENLIEDNDVKNRWVSNHSFAFIKSFEVDRHFLQARNATLTFHGIDTFATIFVNDHPIAKTSNMFVRYQYNIREHLQIGTNELKVVIESPVQKAKDLYKEQSLNYVVPPECVPEIYNGECHVNHIRKMQASFSWDWGPAFPSTGIWKDVELEIVDEALLTDVTVDLYRANNHTWSIVITTFLTTSSDEPHNTTASGKLRALIEVEGGNTIQNESMIVLPLNGQIVKESVILTVDDTLVERWWPNGYGNQPLYRVRVEIDLSSSFLNRDLNIGFRTVELVQEPLIKGDTFYFKINDVPIFAKGSNWIPSSVFPELSAERKTVEHLLKSAKDAHMNMLRVWGGGLYESSQIFYEIADRYGIMIWQDFMFACGMYPTTEDFLKLVGEEVKQNVMRLQYHPSIVIWAGNNENEAALYGNWYGTGNKTIYKQDYIKLYVDVIKTEVEKLDPTTPFVVSSPSDGAYTEKHNYLGPNPYSNLYGDVHYYNYLNNGWNINQYPRTRFASEYGVQSIPSITTLKTATVDLINLSINSTFMKHRQHLIGGYEAMEHLVSENLKIPQTNNSLNDLINYIYLTQVNQAVSIRIQTEFYRQARSDLNSLGEGMTMGALYWQLNDVWQAPSWSSIEFGGRWKMLHYHAQEFFSPIIITPHVSAGNELELYIVSDELIEHKNCSFTVNTYKWNSLTPIHTQTYGGVTIPPNMAKMIASFWLDDYLHQAGCGSFATLRKKCVIEFVLQAEDKRLFAPRNYVYPAPLKSVAFPSVNISVKVRLLNGSGRISNYTDYSIELRSNEIALFVWLDFRLNFPIDGRFSHNGFHMFHGVMCVGYQSKESVTAEMIQDNIRVTSLSDIYKADRNLN